MSHERPDKPGIPRPSEVFGFTEREELYDRVSDGRFREIVGDEQTTVHRVEVSYNNYGEWVFVTASRPKGERRVCVTFYGLGYHEYRERWFTGEWFYYQANAFPDVLERQVGKEDLEEALQQRREEIGPYVKPDTQSGRGRLFEMLADLLDEDGACTEMEDLGDLADWLSGSD